MPKVSIVISTYNRAHMVGRAIKSVLNQTYQDFEVIIVDDASTDNTEEVVKSFNDERLRYIRHEVNSGGHAAPQNTGIEIARGEYIAFLDDDDEWLPEKLEKQVNKFKSVLPDVGVIYCGIANIVEETGRVLQERMPTSRGDIFNTMLRGVFVAFPTVLVRKECFQKVGALDAELPGYYDWDMLIRISKDYKFDYVPEILVNRYFHRPTQMGQNWEHQTQALERMIFKFQDYFPKAVLSQHFAGIGSFYCYKGEFKEASKYFGEAINNNPRNIYNYIRFFLCKLAPRLYQARLRRLWARDVK